jgi:hypothetical protein
MPLAAWELMKQNSNSEVLGSYWLGKINGGALSHLIHEQFPDVFL